MSNDVIEKWAEAQRTAQPCVVVTLIAVRGSTPQDIGAKMFVNSFGRTAGTIGGGKIEAAAIEHAQQLLAQEQPSKLESVEWHLSKDIGMTCGGIVSLLFETNKPDSWPIAIFGAGHIAAEVIALLARLSVSVSCFDHRRQWLDTLVQCPTVQPRLIDLDAYEKTAAELPKATWVLSLTQGHSLDRLVLRGLFSTHTPPFIGVIGSLSKAAALRRELREQDKISTEKLDIIRCPVGLPIGNNSPPEIAISIVAQLLKIHDAADTDLIDKTS